MNSSNIVADDWWEDSGSFRLLHQQNAVRLTFIDSCSEKFFPSLKKKEGKTSLANMAIIDVGCGGGILCEPLSRMGANVTGIDINPEAIRIAKDHASNSGLQISYERISLRDFLEENNDCYDIVCALEVIEHVKDHKVFMSNISRLLKPKGLLFISTVNRTMISYICAILVGEYILKWIPIKTHSWRRFLTPLELSSFARKNGLLLQEIGGILYKPISGEWVFSKRLSVNYIACFRKFS